MLITPAIASEPYCEAAPSRRTSRRSIASGGMVFKSTAVDPRPTEPLRLTNADWWRRLPLTSTSTWSGASPRNVAGRSESVPSVKDGCGKLNDGTSWFSNLLVSVVPLFSSASPEMTSTGTVLSATVRSVRRVPVTIMAFMPVASSASAACAEVSCCANAGLAAATKSAVDETVTASAEINLYVFMINPSFVGKFLLTQMNLALCYAKY